MPVENTIINASRVTTYVAVTPSTGPYSVGFPLYEATDLTALKNDLQVTVAGTLTSAYTIQATFTDGCSTDATITFNSPVTGQIVIRSDRAPRSVWDFQQGVPITAQQWETIFNSITASLRDAYDQTTGSSAADQAEAAAADAEAAKVAAQAASASAAAAYDSFDDRYLGPRSSNPSLDNDGNALLTGALYFNTANNEMRIFNGTVWVAAYVSAGSFVPLSGGTMTGKLTHPASTTSEASINVAPGVAPTSPINGDIWSTSTGFYGRINGSTYSFSVVGHQHVTGDITGLAEYIMDTVAALLQAGTNVSLSYNDAGDALTINATPPAASGLGPDVIVEDQKASGTNGGGSSTSSAQIRTLNTLVRNQGSIASLNGTTGVNLPAGTYYAVWSAPAFRSDNHRTQLYNGTDGAVIATGTTAFSNNGGNYAQTDSVGSCVFTIAATKNIQLRHRCTAAFATSGLGVATGLGTEVYARIEFWKIA